MISKNILKLLCSEAGTAAFLVHLKQNTLDFLLKYLKPAFRLLCIFSFEKMSSFGDEVTAGIIML